MNNVTEAQLPGIPIPGSAVTVAMSPDGLTVYATSQTPDTISAITVSTGAVTKSAALAGPPAALATSKDGSVLYVARCSQSGHAGCNAGSVDVFNTVDLSLATSVSLPQGRLTALSLDSTGAHLYVTTVPSQNGGTSGIADIDAHRFVVNRFLPTPKALLGNIVILPSGMDAFAADLKGPLIHRIDLSTGLGVAKIPVGSRPTGMALSPDASTLYVAHQGLTAIDTETNAVTFDLPVTVTTAAITVSPDGAKCYIADSYESTLDTFDVPSRTVTARVPTGFRPAGIAVTPDGGTSFIAASGSSTVSQIDETTNNLVAQAEAGSEPGGIQVSPDRKSVYAINAYSSNVSVLSTAPFTRLVNIPTGYIPMASVLSPNGARLYVNNYDATITVIDTAAQRVVDTIASAPDGSTLAYGMAINSDGKRLYVLTGYNTFHGILAIDTTTDKILQYIPIQGDIAQIAIGPRDDIAYVSGDSNQPFLIVVDLAQGKQIGSIPVDKPYGVKVAPHGRYIYTGSAGIPSITVIDRETSKVVSTTAVPGAIAIAVNSSGTRLYVTGPVVSVFDTETMSVITTVNTGGPSFGIAAQ